MKRSPALELFTWRRTEDPKTARFLGAAMNWVPFPERPSLTDAPLTEIAFDRFHIEHYLTQAVEEVRRQEFFRRCGADREAVRGKKWLLLTKHRHLPRRKCRELMELLAMNHRLFKAYVFKEQFEHAWTYTTEKGMRELLGRWRKLLNWSRRQGGRPGTVASLQHLVVQFATENPSRSYTRIRGALRNLDHEVGRNTIKGHFGVIAATDFFTVEVLTLRDLVRYVVLFVSDSSPAGCTSPVSSATRTILGSSRWRASPSRIRCRVALTSVPSSMSSDLNPYSASKPRNSVTSPLQPFRPDV